MSVSVQPFDPNPDGTCRVCRGNLHPDSWLCLRCGAAHGERNRCPHCRTVARTVPHPILMHRCSVCGRPRFAPGAATTSTSEESTVQLRAAGQAQRVATVLTYLGYFLLALGMPGLLLTAVVLLILAPGAWVSGIALSFALLPLILWLFARSRSKASLQGRDLALEAAYSQQIFAALRASSVELDVEGIAQSIGLPVARAEQLLTRLNADERMTSRVTEEGELVFGISEPVRLRFAEPQAHADPSAQSVIDAELDESRDVEQPLRRKT